MKRIREAGRRLPHEGTLPRKHSPYLDQRPLLPSAFAERIAESGGWDDRGRLHAVALFRLVGGNYAVVRVRGRNGTWPLPSHPDDGTEVYVDHTPQLALSRASRRGRDAQLGRLIWRAHEWVVRTEALRRLAAMAETQVPVPLHAPEDVLPPLELVVGRVVKAGGTREPDVSKEKGERKVGNLRALPRREEDGLFRGLLDRGSRRGPEQRCCETCPEPLLSGQRSKWCVHCLERLVLKWETDVRARSTKQLVRSGPLAVDLERRRVYVHGCEVKLTATEYALIEQFASDPGKVLTHWTLLEAVWGAEHREASEYLRVYVGRLRRKLDAGPDWAELIATEHGVGYRLVEHPATWIEEDAAA